MFAATPFYDLQPVAYAGPSGPEAVAVADLGTGQGSVITVNTASNTATVLVGSATSPLRTRLTLATGAGPTAVTVADLGNGHPDLVVTNAGDNTIGVFLGNGDGTFRPQVALPVGHQPTSVRVADLGNGHPDLIVADSGDNAIGILVGHGDGTFAPQRTVSTGHNPVFCLVSNLSFDHPSLVTANRDDDTLTLLPGNGDGTFGTPLTVPVDDQPVAVIAGNFDSANIDLVVGYYDQPHLTYLFRDSLKDQYGNLYPQSTYGGAGNQFTINSGQGTTALVETRVVGSRLPGVAAASRVGQTVTLFQPDGLGLHNYADYSLDVRGTPTGLAAGDLGNGNNCLIVAASRSGSNGSVHVFYTSTVTNDPTPIGIRTSLSGSPTAMAVGDLGNGWPDIVTVDAAAPATRSVSVLVNTLPPASVPPLALATRLDTFPAAILQGKSARGTVDVRIDNPGLKAVTGPVTVTVYASATGAVDGGSVALGSAVVAGPFDANGSTVASVIIPSVPTTLAGAYTLLARATYADGPVATATAGPAIAVTPAFTNLAASSPTTSLPDSNVAGTKTPGTAGVVVTNQGNATATGRLGVAVYLSPDETVGAGTLVRRTTLPLGLKANGRRTYLIPLAQLPAVTDGRYHVVVELTDPTGKVTTAATTQTVGLSGPVTSLVPTSATFAFSGPPGAPTGGRGVVTIANAGNVTPAGLSTLTVYASPDGTASAGIVVYTGRIKLGVRPSQSKAFAVRLTKATLITAAAAAHRVVTLTDPLGVVRTLDVD